MAPLHQAGCGFQDPSHPPTPPRPGAGQTHRVTMTAPVLGIGHLPMMGRGMGTGCGQGWALAHGCRSGSGSGGPTGRSRLGSISFLGSPFQCLIALSDKKFSLMSNLNLPWPISSHIAPSYMGEEADPYLATNSFQVIYRE